MSEPKSVRVQVLLTVAERDQLLKIADRRNRSLAYVGREFILAGLKRPRGAAA